MALTHAALAAELGIPVADHANEADPGLVEAGRLFEIAGALVAKHLRGGDCPDVVRDEAVIRAAGNLHVLGGPVASGAFRVGTVAVQVSSPAVSAVRQSGAAALLAPWVRRSA